MKIPTVVVLFVLHVLSTIGWAQISIRANDTSNTSTKEFFYHWDGFEFQWHGPGIDFVKSGDLSGFPASGSSFSQPYSGNGFAYIMSSVSNWDTGLAAAAVASSSGLPPESSPFIAYLNSLTFGTVNRHGGNQYGFGVDNGDARVSPEAREDKIDVPGEALVISFDLQGQLDVGSASGSFGPESSASFENMGLHENARLILKELVIRPWAAGVTGEIDYLFYDASEGTFLKNSAGVSAFREYVDMRTTGSVLQGPWTIEHGDILIIAHPTDTTKNLNLISSELWSMTFDLEFDAPTPAPLDVPSDPADFPQHQYAPGFSNIWRTDGELLAMYRTEPGNSSIRTVVQDFHRGYLLTENRGSTIGNSHIFFDLTDVTSENPSVPLPEDRILTEALKVPNRGNMHTAYSLLPDYRVNHPGDNYVDLAGLSNSTPSIATVGRPPGFSGADGGARSAYILPYHYDSQGNGKRIVDARTGQTLSTFDEYGFGSGTLPVPVGNILLLAKIRAGERAIASYDISDPANPVLLDVMRDSDPRWRHQEGGAYEPAIYNNYFVVPLSLRGGTIGFVDYTDPGNLRMHHIISGTRGAQRYMQFQDHRMFAGTEVIDLTHLNGGITPTEHNFPGHKGEYMLPLGNLVVCAENSEQGGDNLGAIYAFQAEPDVRPPSVTYHVPAADATDQLVTSRIGMVIHETLDATTIDETTFRVFPVSDTTETSIPGTRVWSDKDILTFTPMSPLEPETTYRVVVEGFTDIVSNPIGRYSFNFTTAGPDSLFYPTVTQAGITTAELIVDTPIEFFLNATPDGGQNADTLEYSWDFGDGTVTDWSNANQTISHAYQYPGKFAVRARVRSVNAPERVAMRYLQPSVFFKAAGEDGFEPRFEAERGTLTGPNSGIFTSTDSSGGMYVVGGPNSGLYWDFDSVGGAFDFQFLIAMPEGTSVPGNQSTWWRMGVYVSEIVDGVETNEVFLGEIETRSLTYEYKGTSAYLPREGRYRLRLRRGTGVRDPRVDYVDVKLSTAPIRFEAEGVSLENIVRGDIKANAGASGGSLVDGRGGFNIQWDFEAAVAGTHTLNFAVGVPGSSTRSMSVWIDGELVQVLTSSFVGIEEQTILVDLAAGTHTIELRDTEGTAEFNVDYLDIIVPAHMSEVVLPPLKSSQIVLDEANRLIISVNPDNDTITAIDADLDPAVGNPSPVWEVEVASNPRGLAIDVFGRIWVTCFEAGVITIIDPVNPANNVDLNLGYGSKPHDILFDHEGNRAFISLYGYGQIVQLDATNFNVISVVQPGPTPTALALRSNGDELLVSRFISPADVGEVYSIRIDQDSYAMTLQPTIELAKDVDSDDGPNSGRGLPNYLSHITIDPDNAAAYIASQQVNTLAGTFRDNTSLNHDSTVRSIVSRIDFDTGQEDFMSRIDINDSSQPSALLFSPLGDFLFVALQGNNAVSVIDTATGVSVDKLLTGLTPQGLCFDPTTNRLFVKNFMSRSISTFDLSGLFSGGSASKHPDVPTVTTETLTTDVLLGKQIFYNAADERMSFQGYLSCASCHQNGGHDGVTWDFTQRGEGLRNTTDLRGRSGVTQGNVHWSGNFDEIQDFELDMVNHFGGTGFIESGAPHPSTGAPNSGRSADLDALAAYVTSLSKESVPQSPYRQADGTLTADGLFGRRLFEGEIVPASGIKLNCTDCHVPEQQFTNSQLANDVLDNLTVFNIGTMKNSSGTRLFNDLPGIDTPTLWGLHDGAPYLHDGSAATIEEVFDQFDPSAAVGEDGAAHNLTATGYHLTATEKAGLIAYLLQIDGRDRQRMNATTWVNSWGDDLGEMDEDYDGDRISNYDEYRFGGNPTISDAGGQKPRIVVEDGNLKFRFNRRNNDPSLSYRILHSTDLNNWSELVDPALEMDMENGPIEVLDLPASPSETKEFFKIEFE
ncbi:MAG: Ig-like domain-containing protein [Verrucomicrobiota bacterium]